MHVGGREKICSDASFVLKSCTVCVVAMWTVASRSVESGRVERAAVAIRPLQGGSVVGLCMSDIKGNVYIGVGVEVAHETRSGDAFCAGSWFKGSK